MITSSIFRIFLFESDQFVNSFSIAFDRCSANVSALSRALCEFQAVNPTACSNVIQGGSNESSLDRATQSANRNRPRSRGVVVRSIAAVRGRKLGYGFPGGGRRVLSAEAGAPGCEAADAEFSACAPECAAPACGRSGCDAPENWRVRPVSDHGDCAGCSRGWRPDVCIFAAVRSTTQERMNEAGSPSTWIRSGATPSQGGPQNER